MALALNLLLFSALILAVQPLPQYSCPNGALQLITRTDVSTSDFNEVLSVSLNETWNAPINDVPSNGILTFREPFVLIGLTSAGESSAEGYVDHFLLSYAPSLNSSFQNLSNSFITTSPNEVIFFFEEPILSQRLRLYIITVASITPYYFWRINLIGCPLTNASVTPTMETPEEGRSCQGAVAAAVVVPILILVVVAGVLIILSILYRYRQKSGISKILNAFPIFNEPVHDGARRTSTLKEVDNKAIYNINDNEAYNAVDTSRQDSSGSTSLPLSSIPENQAPIYSEVKDIPDIEAERGEEVLYEHPSVMTD